jgi:uncharacterized membrane protein YgaE (UPF0421/DUF939 family)
MNRIKTPIKKLFPSWKIKSEDYSGDQKKAFDYENLDHEYLSELLENINIGQKMIKIIKKLYIMAKTSINIDDDFLEDIIIKKGIKQGDAFSMWQYTIAITILNKNVILKDIN